ncbi:hypothetical protein AVEN_171525-1 [Araneus ventricosus]|uniref:Tc1-like transposase DDE domain-containing protein n=1 Tax=Araneus ventricosus TaxID=182803 RepID=A0A4Y2TKS4_ARAVE|nr:hypothetical protein AVEN_171525-1 [Araneus ventricosus]
MGGLVAVELWCIPLSLAGQSTLPPCSIALKLFEEHQSGFNHLPWPAQYPELNSMEHLRDEIERSLRSLGTPSSSLTQLRADIMSAWANISQQRCQKIVESIRRRISAVIIAKGGPTRY